MDSRRYLPQSISEVRALSTDEGDEHISGKGIVFAQRSQRLGFFYEYIDTRALDSADLEDLQAYFNHNADYTLGTLRNGTLSINITGSSLDYDITAPTTQTIRDLVLSPIKRGDVTGSSFMFDIDKNGDEWEQVDGVYVRYIKRIAKVYEVGPVSMPAYQQTTTDVVAKRSFDAFIETINKSEEAPVHYRRLHLERCLALYK